MCADRLVLASFYGNATGPIISRVAADSTQCFTVKRKNNGWSQLERPALQRNLDHSHRCVVLPKAVSGFSCSLLLRIGNQFRFERPAIPPAALFFSHFSSLASFSASRATISRVINSFSK